eukprot:CAMPEP_0172306110 /NCGR_PEP_ID=MMETSP1058-20130122/7244_1 /TAXON_ID=83371 /ORGANISM="Detonula confervacea, Strain CCMP 353" /LENGTH=567 /DNA_ID=CAMNT_0013017897 /DNA_START=77 /DNA_END=1780 /DNA_ORIENTATION=-
MRDKRMLPLLVPLLLLSACPVAIKGADDGCAATAAFDTGTKIYRKFDDDGLWYWGEIVSDAAPTKPQTGSNETDYKVRWEDGGYTQIGHAEVADLLDVQSEEAIGVGRTSDESSRIAQFDEPSGESDGRQTCRRIRMRSPKQLHGGEGEGEFVTPEELYIRYISQSVPVVIEGYWKDYVDDPAFRNNWTVPGLARMWQELLDATPTVDKEEDEDDDSEDDDDEESLVGVFYNDDIAFQRMVRVPGKGYRQLFPHAESMNFTDFVVLYEEQERKIMAKMEERRQKEAEEGSQTRKQMLNEYIILKTLEIFKKGEGGYTPFGRYIADSVPPNPLGSLLHPRNMRVINLWAQGREKVSKLHQDREDNFLGILSGTKKLYLVDPSKHMESVYTGHFPVWTNTRDAATGQFAPKDAHRTMRNFSPLDDVLDPDLDRFPKFNRVIQQNELIQCDLNPGDVMFVPAAWWHEVHNFVPPGSYDESLGTEGSNVAINYWFDANPMLVRLHSKLRETQADWVKDGEELDKEFDRIAIMNRLGRKSRGWNGTYYEEDGDEDDDEDDSEDSDDSDDSED